MAYSSTDCISPAIDRTKHLLFKPFRWAFWWRMAIVGMLAGEMGGINANFPTNFPQNQPRHRNELFAGPFPWSNPDPAQLKFWIMVGVVAFFAIVILVLAFLYISSVMRFIFFDAVLSGQCRIREGWSRRHDAGRRFFQWQLIYAAITLSVAILIFGAPILFAWSAGFFNNLQQHIATFILAILAFVFVFMIYAIVFGAIALLVRDLLVPMIALEGVGLGDGLSRIREMVNSNRKDYAIYVLMRFVLFMATAMIFGIAALIVMLVVLIPIVLAGVAFAFLVPAIGKVAMLIIAIPLGAVALLALIMLQAVILLPGGVFNQSYAMYFVGARYAPLMPYMYPPPPAPPAPMAPVPAV